jgi:glycosyltransferase involved in cell wall biosynthesis
LAKIITAYINAPTISDREVEAWIPSTMAYIRWFKISEALARCGHQVDIALPDGTEHWPVDQALLDIPTIGFKALSSVDWQQYDVVKTLFNRGMQTLGEFGGSHHPFIISKLGSVVGPQDMPGIYFYGDNRAELYSLQEKIDSFSKYVTVLSEGARRLWIECHGDRSNILMVPGGVDANIPPRGTDPFPAGDRPRCLFAGLIYNEHSQPEANKTLVAKLNELGRLLYKKGLQLYMMGAGDVSKLDDRYVKYLGVVPYTETWNYFYHAHVGIVVSAGQFMHNNESSKIYHYLRAGLPVVSESGFPNDHLIEDAQLGYVTQSEDIQLMADRVADAATRGWDNQRAVDLILERHTWDQRVKVYHDIITRNFS